MVQGSNHLKTSYTDTQSESLPAEDFQFGCDSAFFSSAQVGTQESSGLSFEGVDGASGLPESNPTKALDGELASKKKFCSVFETSWALTARLSTIHLSPSQRLDNWRWIYCQKEQLADCCLNRFSACPPSGDLIVSQGLQAQWSWGKDRRQVSLSVFIWNLASPKIVPNVWHSFHYFYLFINFFFVFV